jgi:RimJ/RimL family protein N-acetyltransferase
VIDLWPVVAEDDYHVRALYDLLAERTAEQSISHKVMPTMEGHRLFVLGATPDGTRYSYLAWYMIYADRRIVGAIYLSKQREIGVSVFRDQQRKGYARAAVLELMRLHPGKFLANVNPKNEASIKLWGSLGFNLLQVTYAKG